jgi:hypothetical protein
MTVNVNPAACILKGALGRDTVQYRGSCKSGRNGRWHDMGGREQEDTESIGAFQCQLITVWNFSDAVINTIHFFIRINP